jgi:adenosylmethionine---8-amino-7-oxononanoate aminotransferase
MTNILANENHIWHPFTAHTDAHKNIFVTKGEGIYLHTHDGRKIIDAISSWWVNLHGHSHPVIANAIYQQALQLEHVIFAGFTHTPALTLTEKLLAILPSNLQKIFFSDNGSTANEVAIKMAIQYWHNQGIHKKKIVALAGAYHGDTFGAMSVGDRNIFTEPFTHYLFDVVFIDFPDGQNDEQVVEQLKQLVAVGDVGAFIFEPMVQGAAGMRIYSAQTLAHLLLVAKENQVLCIADEVFTGFYRTGKCFATEHTGLQPDIMTISKGITGGTLPLGVTACSQEVYRAFESNQLAKTFLHGHSYTANPLACAAASASYDLLFSEDCQRQLKTISNLHAHFTKRLALHPKISSAQSLGTILSIELKTETNGYENSLRSIIYDYFLAKDILLRPLGNVIYMVPPYVIREEELNKLYDAIEEFLSTL